MYVRVQQTNEFAQATKISLQNRNIEEQLYGAIRVAEAEQRGYLLGGSPDRCLRDFNVAVAHVRDFVRTLKIYLARTPRRYETRAGKRVEVDQYATFVHLSTMIDAKLDELELTMRLAQNGSADEAKAIFLNGAGMTYTDKIQDLMTLLRAQEFDDRRRGQQ